VLKRNVSVGDHLKAGSILFTIVDLSKVWVGFDAYEADIPWLRVGEKINFTVSSLPGVEFTEKITFIDPIINAQTRIASVRVEVNNRSGRLKPEMYANGTVTSKLPIDEAHLTVPKSAVMWTGKRSVVYVAIPNTDKPMFEFREITLGHDLGGYFIVEDGLQDGEMVVTNGTFKVDAAAQLAGKKSMMNKSGGQAKLGHDHGAMKATEVTMSESEGMKESKFEVSGNCDMCKARIEKAALSVDGVAHANWNKDSKYISVHFDESKTNTRSISKAIIDVGHSTEFEKVPDAVYNELPACCKYTQDDVDLK
jgi:Cu(I)/Ag(I) efflux system membrane fusion protein